jgi:hypothetical protein
VTATRASGRDWPEVTADANREAERAATHPTRTNAHRGAPTARPHQDDQDARAETLLQKPACTAVRPATAVACPVPQVVLAHRLGGDAAREGIPTQGCGGLISLGAGAGACERIMTRDGTVGRSDGTERNLPLHWDIDPARVMRPRFADSIRACSPSGLREQAGHMTASDFCAARFSSSCQAGAIHT